VAASNASNQPDQIPENALAADGSRGSDGRFLPGHVHNPHGSRQRNLAVQARLAELRAAVIADFPKPTALEAALIERAADQLCRAETATSHNASVRLTRCAMQLLGQLRQARRDRAKPAGSGLDAYLAANR
jgi:hypothetical protein